MNFVGSAQLCQKQEKPIVGCRNRISQHFVVQLHSSGQMAVNRQAGEVLLLGVNHAGAMNAEIGFINPEIDIIILGALILFQKMSENLVLAALVCHSEVFRFLLCEENNC